MILLQLFTISVVLWVTAGFMLKPSFVLQTRRKLSMSNGQVTYVPYFPDKKSNNYMWLDVYNALGRDRTLFVSRYLDDEACNQLIASLIWLQSDNDKDPITMYFNVPGAISKPALAVFDTLQRMTCPLVTINSGLTVGMGALLCAAGTPGRRSAFPNARFLMAKTGMDDGVQGQAIDIHLQVQEVLKDNVKMTRAMARLTGQPLERIEKDMKRDFYLAGPEAVSYGVIDEVLKPHALKLMLNRGMDNEVVGFGHFAEARMVMEYPDHKVINPRVKEQQDQEARAAAEALKQQKTQKTGKRGWYDGARLKPPGYDEPINLDDIDPNDDGGFG